MRLVIQHEDNPTIVAFEYESKERFKSDLFDALEKYLDMTFSDRCCIPDINVNGLKFKAERILSASS